MAEPLRAQFFVIRHNGSMVPLVAMDELPPTISIRGVPRTLAPEQLTGMTCVGRFDSRHSTHIVDNINHSPSSQLATRPSHYINEAPKSVQTFGSTANYIAPRQDTKLPLLGKKEYCSHWIKTGECNFTQQGCIFKHEMPADLATLNAIGFNDVPQWYRQRYGVPSLMAAKGSDAALGGAGMRRRAQGLSSSIWAQGGSNPYRGSRPRHIIENTRTYTARVITADQQPDPAGAATPSSSRLQKIDRRQITSIAAKTISEKSGPKTTAPEPDTKSLQFKPHPSKPRVKVDDYLSDSIDKCEVPSLQPEKPSSSSPNSEVLVKEDDLYDASASDNSGVEDLGPEAAAVVEDLPMSRQVASLYELDSSDIESDGDIESKLASSDAERRSSEEEEHAAQIAAAKKLAAKGDGEEKSPGTAPAAPVASSVSGSKTVTPRQNKRRRGRRAGKHVQARRVAE